jgi:hypothetical protein
MTTTRGLATTGTDAPTNALALGVRITLRENCLEIHDIDSDPVLRNPAL